MRSCNVYNVQGLLPYVTAWRWQRSLMRLAMDAQRQGLAHPDSLLVVEHPSVYTLGRGSTLDNLKFDPSGGECPHAVHRVERGGEVTWHGPGQLVCYPILDLTHHKKDLHWYWNGIEGSVIDTLASFDVKSERDPAGTGVWVEGSKIAAVGLSASRWITMHGLALNVDPDLGSFSEIVPCGIADRTVTSLQLELDRQHHSRGEEAVQLTTNDVRGRLVESLAATFSLDVSRFDMPAAANHGQSLLESMLDHTAKATGVTIGAVRSESDDGHLGDLDWLAKHQKPL